jgi:hypothetical protein
MSNGQAAWETGGPRRSLGGIHGVAELLRIEGPVTFLTHALQRYGSRLVGRHYFFEFDLAGTVRLGWDATSLPPGIRSHIFQGTDEVEYLARLAAQSGMREAAVEQRVAGGDLVAIALAGDELVGYSWATSRERWASEIGGTVLPREGEIVQYDERVMPKWRGKGLYYPISAAMLPDLLKLGYRRTLVWVDAFNTRSLKNQRRFGKRKIADVVSIPALGILRLHNYPDSDGIRIERRAPR